MKNSYESPFSIRYASEEMQYLFSADKKFKTWRRLWVALARAEMKLGLPVTEAQVKELESHLDDINYDVAEAREKQVRLDVMSHVYAYGVQCPNAKGIIHLGATSCYVGDNTDVIIMKEALQVVRRKLINVIDLLGGFAEKYKDMPTLGFTHFQPAQLTTVGKRATLWIQDLVMDLECIDEQLAKKKLLGSKGTTGTQASFLELFGGDHEKVKKLDLLIAEKMGYEESCYSIIKHEDKDNKHIHILATKVDLNGIKISDSMSKINSGKIMRKLEKDFGLEIMEKGKTSCNRTLGESHYRQYFFDTALHKALRSHNANERVTKVLKESETYMMINTDLNKPYTNSEWKIMLGDDVYEKMLEVLSDSKFFNPLYKDELLAVMDRIFPICKNVGEFRDKLDEENYYMRLISDKGKSYYIYGIPERNFYVKDKSLPEKYRFGKIAFEGQRMAPDEQKHYLYNKIFALLNNVSDYDAFKAKLTESAINLVEHTNKLGIYGLSFSISNIDSPEIFNSSDISRRLTYKNIQEYFRKEKDHEVSVHIDTDVSKQDDYEVSVHDNRKVSKGNDVNKMVGTPIKPVVVCYINTKQEWEREISYMSPVSMMLSTIPLDLGSEKRHSNQEDEMPFKKKKKRKNKGLSL